MAKYLEHDGAGGIREAATATSGGVADAGKIVALDATGRLLEAMMPANFGAEVDTAAASEALSAGDFINLFDDNGTPKIRKADNSNGRQADGFVKVAVASGGVGIYFSDGVNSALSGLTAGSNVFLGTGGGFTQTAPESGVLAQILGKAVSTTAMHFNPRAPIGLD